MATRAPSERHRWWCLIAFCLSAALTPATAKPPDLPLPFEDDFTPDESQYVPAVNPDQEAEEHGPSMADRCEAMRRLTHCALFAVNPVVPVLPMRHVIEYGLEPPYPVLCVGEHEYSVRGFFTAAAVTLSTGPFGPFWLEIHAAPAPPVTDHDPRFLFGGAIIVGPLRQGDEEEAEAVEMVPVMPMPARPCEAMRAGWFRADDAEIIEYLQSLMRRLLDVAQAHCPRLLYKPDHNKRMEELLIRSENLRQIQKEWRRLWFTDQPSHVIYDRIHGGIKDGPAAGEEMPVVCAGYDVTDLMTVYEVSWDRKADLLILVKKHHPREVAKELIHLIRDGVAPETWDVRGGPGTVEFNADLNTLFIKQTEEVQEQVRAFLEAKREENDLRKVNCTRQVIKSRGGEGVTLTGCAGSPVGVDSSIVRAYREILEMAPPRVFTEVLKPAVHSSPLAPRAGFRSRRGEAVFELLVGEEECELIIIEGGQKKGQAEPARRDY